MDLKSAVQTYVDSAHRFGESMPLEQFGVPAGELEAAISAWEDDYHLSRHFELIAPSQMPAGNMVYRINEADYSGIIFERAYAMSSTEPGSLEFRSYQPGDFESLCRLDQICFSRGIAYEPEEIAAALADPRAFAYVAESAQQVVAFILACLTRRQLGHIITIDVHPDYRRRGIGERLMEMAEQHLRDRGAKRIVLEVAQQNAAALAFYERLGFVRVRELPGYYADGSDAYLMEKTLL